MKFKIAPDSQSHVLELAVLAAIGAGLTVIVSNVGSFNWGAWSAVISSGITIVLSLIKNIETS